MVSPARAVLLFLATFALSAWGSTVALAEEVPRAGVVVVVACDESVCAALAAMEE